MNIKAKQLRARSASKVEAKAADAKDKRESAALAKKS